MIARDKQLHFAVGFGISLAASPLAYALGLSPWAGFLVAAVAGMLKELRDRQGFGQKDFLDFWWTGLGGVVPSLVVDMLT